MSNVRRGDRAIHNPDRPLKIGETIEEQEDGSVLSVVKTHPRTVTDPKTGEERILPSSDARTSRVDMLDDRKDGAEPWYLKHMIKSDKRVAVLEREEGAKKAEAAARAEFEAKRDAVRPLNPIRARAEELEKIKAKQVKGKSNG